MIPMPMGIYHDDPVPAEDMIKSMNELLELRNRNEIIYQASLGASEVMGIDESDTLDNLHSMVNNSKYSETIKSQMIYKSNDYTYYKDLKKRPIIFVMSESNKINLESIKQCMDTLKITDYQVMINHGNWNNKKYLLKIKVKYKDIKRLNPCSSE